MTGPVHIASLLIQVIPENRKTIETGLLDFDGLEIAHSDDEGRIIVTLETISELNIVQALTDIQLLTGVVSASLVYHQMDEPEQQACTGT
ncbi:MAG: chaperone NapD [Roseibium sp.]